MKQTEFHRFTVGQTVFIIVCMMAVIFIDFYLGARFGPKIFWDIDLDSGGEHSILPDDKAQLEIESLIKEIPNPRVTFHEVLTTKSPMAYRVNNNGVDEANPLPIDSLPLKVDSPPKKEQVLEKKILVDISQQPKKENDVKSSMPQPVLEKEKIIVKPEEDVAKIELEDQNTKGLTQQIEQELVSYTLQLGVFSTFDEAQSFQKRFKKKGYSAYIVTLSNPHKENWYRVQIGRYSEHEAAKQDKKRVKQIYGISPTIEKL